MTKDRIVSFVIWTTLTAACILIVGCSSVEEKAEKAEEPVIVHIDPIVETKTKLVGIWKSPKETYVFTDKGDYVHEVEGVKVIGKYSVTHARMIERTSVLSEEQAKALHSAYELQKLVAEMTNKGSAISGKRIPLPDEPKVGENHSRNIIDIKDDVLVINGIIFNKR